MKNRSGSLPKRLSENQLQNNMKISEKCEFWPPQKNPKSHPNAPQDPLGAVLGLSLELQIKLGGTKWAQDPCQEAQGPLWTSIF